MGVKIWSHGPPGTPEYGSSLTLGDSNNPHGPWTIGYSKDQMDPKRPLIMPNLKDNGDKPAPWTIPKVNQDEEDPRGPTG
ncbi:hypothetical protein O181_019575 [Austropuccinia psidii MF-1]|uniref:Uncharacterized protein n=1 Tax=Austropuccinia psidii MF-1 TaxID=1389203 RepID=A0A9Q3GV73_9BASI|nr:hypothetical protein [Austropuccinia psidii MF-1]